MWKTGPIAQCFGPQSQSGRSGLLSRGVRLSQASQLWKRDCLRAVRADLTGSGLGSTTKHTHLNKKVFLNLNVSASWLAPSLSEDGAPPLGSTTVRQVWLKMTAGVLWLVCGASHRLLTLHCIYPDFFPLLPPPQFRFALRRRRSSSRDVQATLDNGPNARVTLWFNLYE